MAERSATGHCPIPRIHKTIWRRTYKCPWFVAAAPTGDIHRRPQYHLSRVRSQAYLFQLASIPQAEPPVRDCWRSGIGRTLPHSCLNTSGMIRLGRIPVVHVQVGVQLSTHKERNKAWKGRFRLINAMNLISLWTMPTTTSKSLILR